MLRIAAGTAGPLSTINRRFVIAPAAPARKPRSPASVSTLVAVERKLASVMFVDLVGSTAFVAQTDPEIVRRRIDQFFERVSECVQHHGGIVEKFAGDAVLAAFGIPRAHEDDAVRAVRAAFGILEAVRELGLEIRVGIESGEVVVDDVESTFATGEAVNIAARLQQSAEPNEIRIGPGTQRLAFGRVQVEDVGPVEVAGREQGVWAWVATGVSDGRSARRGLEAPFVGREPELELLQNSYARAVRDRRAHLVTVFGDPGIGKTRLAREFLESLEDATVLTGRALPYGESVTSWPLAEMVKESGGIADDDDLDVAIEKLRECCPAEAVADLLGIAIGLLEAVHGERSQNEIAWAAREYVERLATVRPLVLVFEDIHWAEEPLLELIEHLTEWVRGAPLLILCLARLDLLELRPEWAGGRVRASAVELEPLAGLEGQELVDALLREAGVDAELRASVLEKAEGNPLYVEETVRMLAEQGRNGGAARIPDTLQALIAARIDRLPPAAKTVLQRAAVMGRTFWEGALVHLSPDMEDFDDILETLLQREFVSSEVRSTLSEETAFRFKHVLFREVAYGGLSKLSRAQHHKAFAGWLAEKAGDELLEIRAYHLDQAATLLGELDGAPPPELAAKAAAALEQAGLRALAREANRSARNLLLRAVELEPTLERRYNAGRAAWRLSDLPTLEREAQKVLMLAREEGNTRIEAMALAALAEVASLRHGDVSRARELSDQALELLPEGDSARYGALAARTGIIWATGDLTEYLAVGKEARSLAKKLERTDLEADAVVTAASAYLARLQLDEAGPALEEAERMARESGSAGTLGIVLRFVGLYHLQIGELEQAEALLKEARDLLAEVGKTWSLGRTINYLGIVALEQGEPGRAEQLFRKAVKLLTSIEDRATLCESQRLLAQALVRQGKLDEADGYALEARETVGPQDVTSLATTALALAEVRVAQGRHDEAAELYAEALARVEGTDFRRTELEVLESYVPFLRDRRPTEAAPFEARLGELRPPQLRPDAAAAEPVA
jgi:class 3 adenylate cyclase/tetratricopeptide (TPR) repeat protein